MSMRTHRCTPRGTCLFPCPVGRAVCMCPRFFGSSDGRDCCPHRCQVEGPFVFFRHQERSIGV